MKKLEVCLIALLFALFFLTSTLMAQDTTPPRCCAKWVNSVGFLADDGGMPLIQGEFAVSDTILALQGITRSQFVDRLSESLFPGKAVDVVLASIQPIPGEEDNLIGQSLVDGQEIYFYRIPRYAIEAEDLDMLDKFGLTDGVAYVSVTFGNSVLQGTN